MLYFDPQRDFLIRILGPLVLNMERYQGVKRIALSAVLIYYGPGKVKRVAQMTESFSCQLE